MRGLVLLVALGLATPTTAQTQRTEAAGLRFSVPGTWTRIPASSEMRAAQYRIPHASGDSEDGELILFFFGATKGGGVQDNLDRWYGQFSQPDGRLSRDAAVLTIRTVHGLRVTMVDLPGTYLGGGMGGGAPPAPKPGWRMLGAIIEGEGGPWFLKALGPDATIRQAKGDFEALVDSLEPHR